MKYCVIKASEISYDVPTTKIFSKHFSLFDLLLHSLLLCLDECNELQHHDQVQVRVLNTIEHLSISSKNFKWQMKNIQFVKVSICSKIGIMLFRRGEAARKVYISRRWNRTLTYFARISSLTKDDVVNCCRRSSAIHLKNLIGQFIKLIGLQL